MSTEGIEGPPEVSQLGRYHLVSQIATGGMAEIYVARMDGYAGSDRLCVIKKIRSRIKTDPRAVQMFLDEARIAATLQHPNIVQMFEVGEMDGNYFIAMEYLHGEDMRTVSKTITRGDIKLPLDHAVHIVIDLLAGLHYAHEQRGIDGSPLGIVHRDVSPHNLFVTYDGAVKIVDFGIAKASNREHETKVETLKGKIQYMSPEQCRCIDLDRRSDIYSVGVVLYELTTGRRLNSGDDEYEVMKRTVEGPLPRPAKVIEGYPHELENIVRMALEKKPRKRFQTALLMQQALENFAHDFRLRRSNIELARFMHRLFADRIQSWERGVADGTSIRELVAARHETKGETSGPTFDSAVGGADLDGPSGQLITLSPPVDDTDLEAKSGEIGDGRNRPSPRTSEIYPSIAVADEYASAATSPRLEPVPTPSQPASRAASQAAGSRSRGRLLLVVAALVLLFSAGGVVLGLKISGDSEKKDGPLNAVATETDLDAAAVDMTAVDMTAHEMTARSDAAPADANTPRIETVTDVTDASGPVATLMVRGERGASVYIGGKRVGQTYKAIESLPIGRTTIEVRKRGYETKRERVTLRANETTTKRVRLPRESNDPRPPIDAGTTTAPLPLAPGDLAIKSTPPAQVFLDGRSVGYTSWGRRVAAGKHTVRVRISKLALEKRVNVNIRPNKTTKVVCVAKSPEGADPTYRCTVR